MAELSPAAAERLPLAAEGLTAAAERLIVALDGMGAEQALALAAAIPDLRWVKVGL